MNKILLTLALACTTYSVNAQINTKDIQTALKTTTLKKVKKFELTQSQKTSQITVNAALGNSSQGYIWGPLGFRSSSIVRMGRNFSTFIFKVDGLPINVHGMS
jgi:hypothetical protein